MSRLNQLRGVVRSIAFLVCVLLLAGCAAMGGYQEAPRVSLVSIQPREMHLLEQRYGLQIRIMNPNDEAIPINGLSYSLEINGREFAYGVSKQAVSIPPFGEALLNVDVVSNLLNILQQMQEMSDEQHESLKYRLAGKISLGNRMTRLPFDYSGELTYRASGAAAP